MKNKGYLFILSALALSLIVVSCRKEPKTPIGTDFGAIDGLTGSWELYEVQTYDMSEPVPPSRDVSSFYNPNPIAYDFDNESRTYKMTNAGIGSAFIGSEGTYAFNNEEFPDSMICYSVAGDTTAVDLTKMVRVIDNEMGYAYTKYRCDAPSIQYNFLFIRK